MCDPSMRSTSSTGATRKIALGPATMMYPALFAPTFDGPSSAPKYGVRLLIDKTDQAMVAFVQSEIYHTMMAHYDTLFGDRPAVTIYNSPLHDGDREYPGHPTYRNRYYIDARTKFQPRLEDVFCSPISDPTAIHSGCRGRAVISFRPYSVRGRRGLGCILHALQLSATESLPNQPTSGPECVLNLLPYARYGGAPNDPQH